MCLPPTPIVLPLSTALYELHDVVLRTHSTLVNGPLEADRQRMLMCSALGLAGEAGEFTDLVKKVYEQGRVLDKDRAVKELADVAYYLQLACMALDVSVPDVVQALVAKLAARYPEGFSAEASVNRPKE
jgi:NTP pyrophosphatase (non-canonical NTP hydrolase)